MSDTDAIRQKHIDELVNKALADKDIVNIVEFLSNNPNHERLSELTQLLAKVMPLRCAEVTAPRFSNMGSAEDFQKNLKFSKIEMRLLADVLSKIVVVRIQNPNISPEEAEKLRSMSNFFSIHQCSKCGENDVCCIL